MGRQWAICCFYSDGDPLDPRLPWLSAVPRWEGTSSNAPAPPTVELALLGEEVVAFNQLEEIHSVVSEILTRMQDPQPPTTTHQPR